jgi:hypothetical protein
MNSLRVRFLSAFNLSLTTMPTHHCSRNALALLVLATSSAGAQQRPAARPLGAVLATSTEALGALSAVRELPGGRLLVNDPVKKRVLLMDSTLALLGVVADSTTSAASYGTRAGGLIAYRGDSTLFVDPSSLSMLVIDPAGKIARVMAAPRPDDVAFLVGGPLGNPGFDAQGRLVYRTLNRNFGGPRPQPGQPFTPPPQPDTAPIIRFDLATRKLDTAAFIKTPKVRMNMLQTERGMSMTSTIDPIPVLDDWAVLNDGSIALVRGRDYHVDYVDADGTRRSGAKIPFDWQRLSDDDKTAIIDSTRKAIEAQRAAGGGPGSGAPPSGAAAITGGGGGMVVTVNAGPGGVQTQVGGPPPAGAIQLPPLSFFPVSELADYRPAFAGGSTRADAEGRLWIRTIPTKPLAGGAEYDVIDRDGKLVDRVAIPKGTTIIGFGPRGIVYLGIRDTAGVHVVRTRAR